VWTRSLSSFNIVLGDNIFATNEVVKTMSAMYVEQGGLRTDDGMEKTMEVTNKVIICLVLLPPIQRAAIFMNRIPLPDAMRWPAMAIVQYHNNLMRTVNFKFVIDD